MLACAMVCAVPACATLQTSYEGPAMTTVCELQAMPTMFDQERISVSAEVLSDGIHWTGLVDSSCQLGVVLIRPANGFDGNAASFYRALYSGAPGTTDKEIDGVFVGIFDFRPELETDTLALHLEEVVSFRVRPRDR